MSLVKEWVYYCKEQKKVCGTQAMVDIVWHLDENYPDLAKQVRKELKEYIRPNPRLI